MVVFCFVPFCLLVCLLGLALGMSIKLQYKFNSVDYGDRGGEKKKQKKKDTKLRRDRRERGLEWEVNRIKIQCVKFLKNKSNKMKS